MFQGLFLNASLCLVFTCVIISAVSQHRLRELCSGDTSNVGCTALVVAVVFSFSLHFLKFV